METSQRLVDPSRQFTVPTSYSWQKSYQAALLETDWMKMQERVQRAESEIHQRRLVLSQDHSGTDEERTALVNAMSTLRCSGSKCSFAVGTARKPVLHEPHPFRPTFESSPDKAS